MAEEEDEEFVFVLDFGSQYSQLICRRCREAGVFSRLLPFDAPVSQMQSPKPKAIILSGGPASVNEEDAPHLQSQFWDFVQTERIPVLGICYGLQESARFFGGSVGGGDGHREYGNAEVQVTDAEDPLLVGVPKSSQVWMSHGEKVVTLPEGFKAIARSETCHAAAASCRERRVWGIQFHVEVTHTDSGSKILENFLRRIGGCVNQWTVQGLASHVIEKLHRDLGDTHVIGAVSGGVDSTVAAALVHRAIGPRFHGVFVDNGLLRKGEAGEVMERLARHIPGLNLTCVPASDEFLSELKGVSDPEEKRRRIGGSFIRVFEKRAHEVLTAEQFASAHLLQGTLYPDVIESVCCRGPSHTIKTHHNVGGLPERMKLKVIEPLRTLFKDEVRQLGLSFGIPRTSLMRHPFPGPGLGVRIVGEVTRERLAVLREADAIFIEELEKAGLYDDVSQAFVVLAPNARSVGVMGDGRTYEMAAVIRAVTTYDFMTADWFHFPSEFLRTVSRRIGNEVVGVNRICVDITSKPPATIEWE